MAGPEVVRWSLTAAMTVAMTAVAMTGLVRLFWIRRTDRRLDAAEIIMSLGVLAMLVPAVNLVPATWWMWTFAAMLVWLLAARTMDAIHVRRHPHVLPRCRGWTHYVHHVMASLAMLYMLVGPVLSDSGAGRANAEIAAGSAGMPGMAAASSAAANQPPVAASIADAANSLALDRWLGLLPGALVAYFLADAVLATIRSNQHGRSVHAQESGRLARLLTCRPLAAGRHVAMALAMAVMLLPSS